MRGSNRGLLTVLGVLILLVLLGPVVGGGWGMMGPGMMWGPGYWAGGDGWGPWMLLGWLPMITFWTAVVVGLMLLVRAVGDRPRRSEDDHAGEPARRRDAAGEIAREESERQRGDVSGVS